MALFASADDIALALLERAATLAVVDPVAGGVLPVAMPDVPPPWGEAATPDRYLSITIFDNVPRWQASGPGAKIGQGILQVEVIWPRGTGVISIRKVAQAVMDHFPKHSRHRHDSASVKVQGEPWHGSVIPAAAGTSMSISIPWVAEAV